MAFGTDIHGAQRMNPNGDYPDFYLRHHQVNVFLYSVKYLNLSTQWICMKFCTDILNTHRMYPNDFGDPMTFHTFHMQPC